MAIVDYLNKQDWDGAIAECTGIIDRYAKNGNPSLYDAYAYMNRGYAHCFVPSQNDNYQEAVDDLSMAITLVPDDVSHKIECLAKRAYAYWLGGRYDSAIADCKEAAEKIEEAVAKAGVIVPYLPFVRELLGNIYSALDYPCKAVKQYKIALSNNQFSPGLLDKDREAREKLNRRR
jgi:tetratricopeptide (TPR) repeat protein